MVGKMYYRISFEEYSIHTMLRGGCRTEYLCKNCVVTVTDQAVTAQVM